jgi:translocation and assembly module TamB
MRIRHFGFVALIAAGLALTLAVAGRGADNDKGIVASLLSRVLSTPTTRVSIGSVSGALSSDVTISDIAIADRDGVWLKVDKLHLIWTRSALLLGRLEVDTLEIGAVSILRRPLPAEAGAPVSDAPILPEVPLKVVIQKFGLGKLDLGEAVVGEAASLTASGTASLGNPSEGLKLRFDARRLDADCPAGPGAADAAPRPEAGRGRTRRRHRGARVERAGAAAGQARPQRLRHAG